MNKVQPIKNKQQYDAMIKYYMDEFKNNANSPFIRNLARRNAFLLEYGVIVGLPFSKLRLLTLGEAIESTNNQALIDLLFKYAGDIKLNRRDYLFPSRQKSKGKRVPIGRTQAFNIISEAGEFVGLNIEVSVDTIRKTFAYRMLTINGLAATRKALGHASSKTTLDFLQMTQEQVDELAMNRFINESVFSNSQGV